MPSSSGSHSQTWVIWKWDPGWSGNETLDSMGTIPWMVWEWDLSNEWCFEHMRKSMKHKGYKCNVQLLIWNQGVGQTKSPLKTQECTNSWSQHLNHRLWLQDGFKMASLRTYQGKQTFLQLQLDQEDSETLVYSLRESNQEFELWPPSMPSESSKWALDLILSDCQFRLISS